MTPTDLNDARLIALTGSLVEGLSAKPELFPNMPVDLLDLARQMRELADLADADSAFEQEMAAIREREQQAMEDFVVATRQVIEYLKQLQEHGLLPAELGPPPLDLPPVRLVPGPCHQLRAADHGPESIELIWYPPLTGSRVLCYEVERAQIPCGAIPWEVAVTSLSNRVVLPQADGTVFIYRVTARGAEGLGEPSGYVAIRVGEEPEYDDDDDDQGQAGPADPA
jgi:hypothetical protein